jgi:hypothetical protein
MLEDIRMCIPYGIDVGSALFPMAMMYFYRIPMALALESVLYVSVELYSMLVLLVYTLRMVVSWFGRLNFIDSNTLDNYNN